MSTRTILAALALSSATGLALAQASSPSREDVKAETKAAAKNRELTPAGAAHPVHKKKAASHPASSPARADVQAETKAATNEYQLGATPPTRKPANAASSPLTREQRKAQTKADVKAGEIAPAGQGVPK